MRGQKTVWKNMLFAGMLFLLGGVFHSLDKENRIFFAVLSCICYACLIFLWGFSIQRRILKKTVRNMLLTGCALMLMMLFLRAGKYYFFPENERLRRLMWYGYYIPTVFAPLMSFLASTQMKASVDKDGNRFWNLLFIPATLLTVGILTNDAHQLAFRFQENFENWGKIYAHSVMYYAAIIWGAGFTLASIVKIVNYCRVVECRRLAWIPVGLFFVGCIATEGIYLNRFHFFQIPEMLCLTFAIPWEGCIQIGLLLSNRNYETFFMHSGLSARLVDAQGQVWYEARADFKQEEKRENRVPISGGSIVWVDDLTQIHRLNAQLIEAQERLDEQTELINAENEMKEKRAKLEEKKRLYDQMRFFALPTLEKIGRELQNLSPDDPAFPEKMMRICVRGAYVKRRSNFMLLLDNQPVLPCEELSFGLQESLEYLALSGGNGTLTREGNGWMRGEALLLTYDFFEALLEGMFSRAVTLMAHLKCDAQGMTLRLVTEQAYVPTTAWKERFSRLNGSVDSEQRDDVCYTTLHFPKEQTV